MRWKTYNMPINCDQCEDLPRQGEHDAPDPCPYGSSILTREKKNRYLGAWVQQKAKTESWDKATGIDLELISPWRQRQDRGLLSNRQTLFLRGKLEILGVCVLWVYICVCGLLQLRPESMLGDGSE